MCGRADIPRPYRLPPDDVASASSVPTFSTVATLHLILVTGSGMTLARLLIHLLSIKYATVTLN